MSRVAQLISRLSERQVDSTVDIQRNTTAVDAAGSVTDSWGRHLNNIPAVVQIRSGAEAVRYGRENNRAFGTVYVQAGLDITGADRLRFGSPVRTFDIQSVRTPDERLSTDSLAYMILEIEETSPSPS